MSVASFCSSTNHSCWNGEKSLEARDNNSEKCSKIRCSLQIRAAPEQNGGTQTFFSSGLPWEVLRTGWNYSNTDQWATDIVLKHSSGFSALHLLFVFISNWKKRKGEAAYYWTFCLSAHTRSRADVGMESVREAEIDKYSKPWTCTLMCVTVKLSAETAGKTAYLLKRRGTAEQKENELRIFPQL